MGQVHKLSDDLANQIAAGEVVERPSSIVKELVENALDADATRITVELERGGSALVRVTDDGVGMSSADALLALERHATSKIKSADDLFRLGTLGFRGEALPSIASVSRLLLRTRAREATEGCEVEAAGGRPVVRPAGGASGTSVEVRDLFFNVPARRKFLKATATESAHAGDVILGAALSRPDVTFTLTRDGRTAREYLRVASRAERARAVHGGDSLAHVLGEAGPLRIEAMLAAPERARSGASGLSLVVNGRPVRDRALARAVANAYGSVLEAGRYPAGVVWLDLPSELVDVNVHPQKAEVRFMDARGVFGAVTRELHGSLARAFGLPELGANPFARPAPPPERGAIAPPLPPPWERKQAPLVPTENLFRPAAPLAGPPLEPATAAEPSPFPGRGLYAALRFVGQVQGTFLVCEGPDGLYILDQHAAAERVTFDRLRRAHAARAVAMQRLLVPEIVDLAPSEVALLESSDVARFGVELRAVGESSVAVHAVPALLTRAEPARVARDLASELSRVGGRPLSGAVDLVLATMACHGSIRAGDAVSREEAEALLAALDEVDFAGHCPHGRPVVMRVAYSELMRHVGR